VLRKFLGSYIAVLGDLDLLVFTGGIGEHDADTRREVCGGLEARGIFLDAARNQSPQKNAHGQALISTDDSPVKVMVISPLEDLMIANHVYSLLNG
jgi:acetate kinase